MLQYSKIMFDKGPNPPLLTSRPQQPFGVIYPITAPLVFTAQAGLYSNKQYAQYNYMD